MKRLGLAAQLIAYIVPAAAIIFLAFFIYTFQASKQAMLAEVLGDARNLTQATVYQIAAILQGIEKVPRNLPQTIALYPQTCPDLEGLIRRSLAINPEIYGIAVGFEPHSLNRRDYFCCPYGFRPEGKIELRQLGSPSYHYFLMDWYQIPKELGQPVWSEPYYDEGGGDIIMATYSVPFYRGTGQTRQLWGVVTADISLFWLQEMVAAVKVYQSGYAFLISRNGVFVTHPLPELIMKESIFSLAAARGDEQLRRVGRAMVDGQEGFEPVKDLVTGKPSLLYYAPLGQTGWTLGVIFPKDELLAGLYSLSRNLSFLALVGLALLAAVIIFLARSVTRPLRRLAQSAAVLGQGDFTVAVPETGAHELGHLAQSFNRLGSQLTDYIAKRDFIRDTFGRYVTQEVVDKLLESREALELGGETREITILMSDLRGFTALTAEMAPERVIAFLNRYLGKMIEILIDHQAVIDEIIGDGILAFFGAPESLVDHPERGVACALSMQAAMAEINAVNEAEGVPHLEMGIAVNTGVVVVGNIGSERRRKYSAVGSPVNFAGRMDAYSLGGQVLISQATYDRVREVVTVRQQLQVEMKGVSGKVILYDVQGMGGHYDILLPDRRTNLRTPAEWLPVQVQRLKKKIVAATSGEAWITRLSETAAVVKYDGELAAWEDVRLVLLAQGGGILPGKIYGKVVSVEPAGDRQVLAEVHFTSVSPEIYQLIRQIISQE